jgi:hypothetical protein
MAGEWDLERERDGVRGGAGSGGGMRSWVAGRPSNVGVGKMRSTVGINVGATGGSGGGRVDGGGGGDMSSDDSS